MSIRLLKNGRGVLFSSLISRRAALLSLSLLPLFFLLACQSEVIRQQAETIREQREEIERTRRDIEEIQQAQQRQEERRRACNRAFREFEQGQTAARPEEAAAFYREGLKDCPDDDVAHYELGRTLQKMGRLDEAKAEFGAAIKINPGFHEARRQLEALSGNPIEAQEIR